MVVKKIVIENENKEDVNLILEPFPREYIIKGGGKAEIYSDSSDTDSIEVFLYDKTIEVYTWGVETKIKIDEFEDIAIRPPYKE